MPLMVMGLAVMLAVVLAGIALGSLAAGLASARWPGRLSDRVIATTRARPATSCPTRPAPTTMVRSRRLEATMERKQRQGQIGTFAPATGQEACQVGAMSALEARDWLVPSFRELPVGGQDLLQADAFGHQSRRQGGDGERLA